MYIYQPTYVTASTRAWHTWNTSGREDKALEFINLMDIVKSVDIVRTSDSLKFLSLILNLQ